MDTYNAIQTFFSLSCLVCKIGDWVDVSYRVGMADGEALSTTNEEIAFVIGQKKVIAGANSLLPYAPQPSHTALCRFRASCGR
jgi:hypothetical protein